MIYELDFNDNNEFKKLYDLYLLFSEDIKTKNGIINKNNIIFNVYQGDITKGIKWTWGINELSINYFDQFLKSINLYQRLENLFNNKFQIGGVSFITLYTNEILEKDSTFHLDIMSQYDNSDTNIITVLIPLEMSKNAGNLQYKIGNIVNTYKYKKNKLAVWDSCKIWHRTEPFSNEHNQERVILSLNMMTDEPWAKNALKRCIGSQGNIIRY